MSDVVALPPEAVEATASARLAPEAPIKPPGRWMKDNLFSSVGNTLQTLIFGYILIKALQFVLGLIFDDEVNWAAVTTNMRLLMTYFYPSSQYGRVWFSVGALLVTAMLTVAAFGLNPAVSLRKILVNVTGAGAFITLLGVLAPTETSTRVRMIIVGAVIAGIGIGLLTIVKNPQEKAVPFWQMLLGAAAFVLAVFWFVPFGNTTAEAGELVNIPGTIKQSTKLWWTLIIGAAVAAFFLGQIIASKMSAQAFRLIMLTWWALGPLFLIFLVLRDPAFDWNYVLTVNVPIALGFGVGGAALLYFLAKPGNETIARITGYGLLAICAITFILAFTGAASMLQIVRLSILALGLVALLAPTFAGEHSVRLRFGLAWLVFILLTHWLITGINTESTLSINIQTILGGFAIPLTLGYYVMLASFPLGILMALARTSTLPIFRVMSTIYIEGVRGVPLIVILFFFDNLLNLFLPSGMSVSKLAAIFIGYSLFSAAYMAENIRGGLQSVRQGQFEASDALGLTTLQRTMFIILPQALRVSIPNLVGQAIATFKETSLVAIIGAFDLLNVARNAIPNQAPFLRQIIGPLLFVSALYWVFAYSMSRASRSLETKLGVGSR